MLAYTGSSLYRDGPTVRLVIGVHSAQAAQLRAEGKPVPPPIGVTALVDTGSRETLLSQAVIEQLGLACNGRVPMRGVLGDPEVRLSYYAQLIFDPDHAFECRVVGIDRQDFDLPLIIGRNVLTHCVMVYNGPAQSFTLAF